MTMDDLFGAVDKFFTVQAICGYVAGAFTAVLIVWLSDRKRQSHDVHKIRLMAVIWAVMVLFVGYVSIGIERNTVCIIEVLGTLASRARLSDQADQLSDKRDEAATNWITTKDFPPPSIAALRWEDPVRQQWIHDQDAYYVAQIRDTQSERRKALADKAAQQVPESRCGRN